MRKERKKREKDGEKIGKESIRYGKSAYDILEIIIIALVYGFGNMIS